MRKRIQHVCQRALYLALMLLLSPAVHAYSFDFKILDQRVDAVLNTTMTLGAAWRIEERSKDLVGKSNNNPDLCGRAPDGGILYQSCQGLFRDQTFVTERLASGRGQFTTNADDGNLNYDKGDMIQAPFKLTQDLTLNWGDFGFFGRILYFHDFVNDDFREYHPNRITRENRFWVGEVSTPGDELVPFPGIPLVGGLPLTALPVTTARTDSVPCPPERNPSGQPCGIVYGKGGVVRNKRSDSEVLRQIGSDFQLLDFNIFGEFELPWGNRDLLFTIGRQTINWGESAILVFDSLNQANPINANNFFRVGGVLEESFTPVNMIALSTELTYSTSISAFYQLEWEPLEAPAPGSYYSPLDIGTNNAINTLNLGFGSTAEDPDRVASLLDNPLSGLTNTTGAARRLPDREPDDGGQFGISLRHYAEWLNNGTEIALYYMNYHSRVPFLSVQSVPEGCAKNSTNTVEFLLACPNTPLFHALTTPNDPQGATSDAVNFDKIGLMLEYPEDIQMFGMSFNTVFGDLALQGEVAYRPDAPLQVDSEDLALAGFGPAASNCHLPETGCPGSTPGIGVYPDGSTGLYQPSNYVVDANGTPGSFTDTYDLIVGHMAGAGRFFPNFIIPYRGGTLGLNPGNSYIRGWEEFDTYQFNLGGTYIMGTTHWASELLNTDQIILLMEAGATWVPDIPDLDELQLEAPGTFLHASAGADGSGADRSRQACSTNQACSFGPDGLRFNPHQEDLDLFPDEWSYGYALLAVIRYESVLPGISLQPIILFKHDVGGTSPGLVSNFIEGRKLGDVSLEVRYKSRLSFNFGYSFFADGGKANLMRDRDNARFFVKYQF